MPSTPIRANEDPQLAATVVARWPLIYSDDAEPALDRPRHVRAASGITVMDEELVIIQDDAQFLAVADLRDPKPRVRAIALPPETDGRRQFGTLQGNKKLKWDLEACFSLHGEIVALGSGSTKHRERVVRLRGSTTNPALRVVDAHRLYASLRAQLDFAGSELNIEGATVVGSSLRLFQRGNGAVRGGVLPVNATCDLPIDALRGYLDEPLASGLPPMTNIVRFDLGTIDICPLSFTDATAARNKVYYLAVAENSPNTFDDGHVSGAVLGVIHETPRSARWAILRDSNGLPLSIKPEGLAPHPTKPNHMLMVLDADDPSTPAELCEVKLDGPW